MTIHDTDERNEQKREDLCHLCGEPVEGWIPELGDAPVHQQCVAELVL